MKSKHAVLLSALLATALASTTLLASSPGGGVGAAKGREDNPAPGLERAREVQERNAARKEYRQGDDRGAEGLERGRERYRDQDAEAERKAAKDRARAREESRRDDPDHEQVRDRVHQERGSQEEPGERRWWWPFGER